MKTVLFAIFLFLAAASTAQTIEGRVTNHKKEALAGASVVWAGTSVGTVAGSDGHFAIERPDTSYRLLVALFVGYSPDTIQVTDQQFITFTLNEVTNLDEVTISGEKPGVIISNNHAIKTEQITQTELAKSSCCDLAGCFETQTTVQPQTTNVLTNAKELRILGLSGVYNQVLIDGFPMIQGLSYTYGISGIPGTLVDNIYVAKGANSVLQGYESISGQINVETIKPDEADRLLLNAYINSFAEKHVNAHYSFMKNKWSNLTAFHMVQPAVVTDRDKDRFMDLPLLTRYMLFNKWYYGDENARGLSTKIGFRFLNEERTGGQTFYYPESHRGSTAIYGQQVQINHPELWTKTNYRFNNRRNVVFYASAFHQQQRSYFGSTRYRANQTNAYGNLQYEWEYGEHGLKTGLSFRYLDLREDIGFSDTFLHRTYDGIHHRTEYIPGVFAENTMHFFNDRFTWVAGLRSDRHNRFGNRLTPRTLIKVDVTSKTVLRANFGTGWRTVNLFSENINLLASSRNILIAEDLKPERAMNYGFSATHKFEAGKKDISGFLSADLYRTVFQNQIFPDYYSNPTLAIIQNFTDQSISNGIQVELFLKFMQVFEVKTGYNFLDVYRKVSGVKQTLPFNPRHRILATFSYKPLSDKFHLDANLHWYGQQHLPSTSGNPEALRRPSFSKPYTVVNAQFTYAFKRFEIYTGCENIFDFRQLQPILDWQNPFSPYFDTSSVWGPTRGREFYLGLRYKLKPKE